PIVAVTPSAEPTASATHSTDKWKQVAEPQGKKKGSKRKAPTSSEEAAGNQRIIFHKNRGRLERIFNQKMKKSCFGPNGKGSTPDKAFSLT
nr:pectin lyase-like superfamily protein [Tanacetum cinerariifolium]